MSQNGLKSQIGYTGELPPAQFNMARYCLQASAARWPHKVALLVVSDAHAPLEDAEVWTYAALDKAVRSVAAGLLAEGFVAGERLMIRMPNTSDYALLFFGSIAAGLVPLPSSSQLTDTEATFLLGDSDASAVAIAGGMALDAGHVRLIDEAMVARLKSYTPLADYADTRADDPAFLVYTSGTSGRPKGVLHAQRSAWGRRPMYQGWYGISANDTVLHAGAFNWTYTLGVGLTDPWANGATTVLYNGEKDTQVWPVLLERTGATLFAAVPTLYRQILKYCDLAQHDLSKLRHGLIAGEAMSATLLDHWRAATGKELYEALGMSECSTYISTPPGTKIRVGSPGKPQTGRCVAALPVDGGDVPLPVGEIGLLAVHRSDPGLMLGYWRRPDEDAEVFRGDWFIGGDLASFDADGYLWYQGRADDVMNAMGYRVSPQEVEAALAQHASVAEVAVTELKVREDISVIAAFIVLKEGVSADVPSLQSHAKQNLAAYKAPREYVFVEILPRTANGKVRRKSLQR
ncbi:MAG: AMP-binding protein [Pseudomonadota bacterium]